MFTSFYHYIASDKSIKLLVISYINIATFLLRSQTETFFFNPKTVFWTNVGKIVLIYFFKNTSLDVSCTRLGYFS